MIIDYTPVVYLSIPARATPKDLSVLLADYLGMVQRGRDTQTDITNHVLSVLSDVGTELVIIDDVHFLDMSAKEGRVVNDHLKYIANETAATFVYTGVDLEKSGLFLEGQAASRATQTSGRNTRYPVRKFGCKTAQEKARMGGDRQSAGGHSRAVQAQARPTREAVFLLLRPHRWQHLCPHRSVP